MDILYKSYNDIPQISSKDSSYLSLEPFLAQYFKYKPDLESFDEAISEKKLQKIDRPLLYQVIKSNYENTPTSDLQNKNIKSILSEDTFTVTTAHQPTLLGGPLYYIYKICSAINLSQQLNVKYPDKNIVPVFVNGSEDHDFEEIDHLNIFGKKIIWSKEAKGPVGRLNTDGLEDAVKSVLDILGNSQFSANIKELFHSALQKSRTYNDFVFIWLNNLFDKYGLLVLNMDNKKLKQNFIPVLEEELLTRPSEQLILETQRKLTTSGFKPQAHPRDINLFYLGTGDRLRITFENNLYSIVGSNLKFTKEEILSELYDQPENFSPNVVMRPLYQEYSLPNLAYIGGGGEMAYWLERKSQFDHFNVPFPMLVRRNSVMLVSQFNQNTLSKLGLNFNDIFENDDAVINKFLLDHTKEDIGIDTELKLIEDAYIKIADKAKVHDPNLEKTILADMTKHLKQVENLGGRIKRSIKSKEESNVKKIIKLRDKLFPNNGLQERNDNFLQYYSDFGPSFIDYLVTNLNPMDRRFIIINF